MVEEKMLVKATIKVGTEVYFLGNFGMQSLQHDKLPNVDSRPNKYQESINIRLDNGSRVRNKRQDTARTSSNNKQHGSSTSKKSSVTPSAKKKARTGPKPSLSSSNEELPKRLTKQSSKNKDGALINGKSTSDDESEKPDESSTTDDKSKNSNDSSSSDEESKRSEHSSVEVISS
jgi:hypothetical protein